MNDAKRRLRTGVKGAWLAATAASGLLVVACWISPAAGAVVGIALLIAFTVRLTRITGRLRDLQNRDPLTGIASHAGFLAILRGELLLSRRDGTALSVAVLDCDCLKRVNDAFGHSQGDQVLKRVAGCLSQVTGSQGTVARLWGDCFGLVLPVIPFAEVRELLEEVSQRFEVPLGLRDCPVTLSIGSVTFERAPEDPRKLVSAAERLMYAVKRNGKDGVSCRHVTSDHSTDVEASVESGRGPTADHQNLPAASLSTGI